MKKGLRRVEVADKVSGGKMFERGPDEEGIETTDEDARGRRIMFERGPDEEGIETE